MQCEGKVHPVLEEAFVDEVRAIFNYSNFDLRNICANYAECRRIDALARPVIGPKLKIPARPPAPVACHLSLGCQAVMHAAAHI